MSQSYQPVSIIDGATTPSVGGGGGGGVQSGLIASRPAASSVAAGTLYKCTDSPYEYLSDGAAWTAFAFGYKVVEPVLASMNQINVGATTFDSTHGGIIMSVLTQFGSEHVQVIGKAVPGSGPYYVEAACIQLVVGTNGGAGCGVSQSASGSTPMGFISMGFDGANPQTFQAKLYNSPTSFNANYSDTQFSGASPMLWSRVYDDGSSNRSYYVSSNGYVWNQIHTEGRTTLFTPGQGIFCMAPFNSNMQVHLIHFTVQ